jgi:hypothetical protein
MQLLLPVYTGQQIADQLRSEWGIEGKASATVKAFPFFKIWRGEMDSLLLRGEMTRFSDVMVDEWEIDMQGVRFQPDSQEEISLEFAAGRGYARISESSVQDFLGKHSADIENPRVVIRSDQILYSGQWDSGIIRISFSAAGYPYVDETGNIRLRLERISVGPFDIPYMIRDITESFLLGYLPDQEQLLIAQMRITEINLTDGAMRIELRK